jgi:hypothetical protein
MQPPEGQVEPEANIPGSTYPAGTLLLSLLQRFSQAP